MLEMIISLAIIAVMFAVMLPQFKNIQNSWASKQATAEALQNGRILIDRLSRDLAKAAQITAVSDPCDTTGYIEFVGNDAITYRYEIGADNIVEFGPVGTLSDLAGPVSRLQFTCYDDQDLDTPITTVGDIRSVNVQITVTNAGPGQEQTFTTQAYLRTNPANTGLIAHWKFDEGSGSVAADSSPSGYDATVDGATWISGNDCPWMGGAAKTALNFDGWNDYVDVENIEGEYDEFTFACYLKVFSASWVDSIMYTDSWSSYGIDISLLENSGTDYAIELALFGTEDSSEFYFETNTVIFTDRWYHLAITYTTSSEGKIYLDGRLDNQLNDSARSAVAFGASAIGAWDLESTGLTRFLDGRIDDVRLYSRVLDPCEIADLAGTRAGVVGHWKFDETSGSTAYDSSGNGIDASVSGAAWEAGGQIDGALDFDGNDDYVDTTIACESIEYFTFCTWFQSDDAGSIGDDNVAQRFFTQRQSGGTRRLAFGINNDKVAVNWHDGSSNIIESGSTLNSGQWYNAAVTYDGSDIRIYVDGVETDAVSEDNMTSSTVSIAIQIGRQLSPTGGQFFFDGLLDDVRIYHRALTEAEIQAVYNQSEYCCQVSGGEILP